MTLSVPSQVGLSKELNWLAKTVSSSPVGKDLERELSGKLKIIRKYECAEVV